MEKYLTLITVLRQLSVRLGNQSYQNRKLIKKWAVVKKGIDRTLTAFTDSVNLEVGYNLYTSLKLNVHDFTNSLKSDVSIIVDNEIVPFHEHPTDHLAYAIDKLRKENGNEYRIIVFIDDLDRCTPDKALEILESIKAFFDIEGMIYVIYVIAMDSSSIDSIAKKKYGEESSVKGIDYLKKIV